MSKFQHFYNAAQGDSINALFGIHWTKFKLNSPVWTQATAAEKLEEYGTLKSFRYLGVDTKDPQPVHVFQTVFSKAGKNTTSLTLDDHLLLGTFRLLTTSEGIAELVKKSEGGR
jgi:hypothetical protein